MTYIQKFTLGIIFTFFSINMLGCSGGGSTTVSKSPPTIQLSPALDFDFGIVTEGNMASPLEVVITNVGEQQLDISSISITDTLNFKLDPNSGANPCINLSTALPAGDNCTVEITFTPNTFPAALSTELAVNSGNAPNKTLILDGTSEQVSNALTVTINQVETATCDVTAYVSVTDQRNFPVEDLSAADFTITEGGINIGSPISSDIVDIVTKPISIAIVMDNSGSMQPIDVTEMNKAATEVIGKLADTDEAEIIKFDKSVFVVEGFTTDKALLTAAIDSPFDGSGTALYDAIQKAITDTKSQLTERKAIILITDGADDGKSSTATLNGVIGDAKAEGIPIFVIALGNFDQTILDDVLEPIASDTSGELYEADVAQNFSTIIEQKLTEVLFVDQYVLNYTSGGTTNLTIDIDVGNSGVTTGTDSKSVTSCL